MQVELRRITLQNSRFMTYCEFKVPPWLLLRQIFARVPRRINHQVPASSRVSAEGFSPDFLGVVPHRPKLPNKGGSHKAPRPDHRHLHQRTSRSFPRWERNQSIVFCNPSRKGVRGVNPRIFFILSTANPLSICPSGLVVSHTTRP